MIRKSSVPPPPFNPIRIGNLSLGKKLGIIFQRELGNDPHGLVFPVMIGLAQGLSGSAVCMCMEAGDIG